MALRPDPVGHRHPLQRERLDRHLPPAVHGAQARLVTEDDVVEEHLVEPGIAGHVAQRPHLHARGAHVDEEHREPAVLGHPGVGAREQQPEVGVLGVGGPDLLAVDPPVVPIAHGRRAQGREVRPRVRLGEQLAPDLVGPQQRPDESLLLRRRAGREDRRPAHAHGDGELLDGQRESGRDVGELALLGVAEALPAVRGGPGDPGQAGVVQLGLERPGERQVLVRSGGPRWPRRVGTEPGPCAVGELTHGRTHPCR